MTEQERIEELESLVASLTQELDSARAELHRSTALYEPEDVVVELWTSGVQITAETVADYAWNHPDWFMHGVLTALGAKHVRITGEGSLALTWFGADEVIRQYVGERR